MRSDTALHVVVIELVEHVGKLFISKLGEVVVFSTCSDGLTHSLLSALGASIGTFSHHVKIRFEVRSKSFNFTLS